jgi:hypothetical protein
MSRGEMGMGTSFSNSTRSADCGADIAPTTRKQKLRRKLRVLSHPQLTPVIGVCPMKSSQEEARPRGPAHPAACCSGRTAARICISQASRQAILASLRKSPLRTWV